MGDVNQREAKREKRSGGDIPSSEKEEDKMLQNEMTRNLWNVVAGSEPHANIEILSWTRLCESGVKNTLVQLGAPEHRNSHVKTCVSEQLAS